MTIANRGRRLQPGFLNSWVNPASPLVQPRRVAQAEWIQRMLPLLKDPGPDGATSLRSCSRLSTAHAIQENEGGQVGAALIIQ